MNQSIPIHEHTITLMRFSNRRRYDLRALEGIADKVDVREFVDEELNALVLSCVAFMPTEFMDSAEMKSPATLWDAVKHFKALPNWILRRLSPPRYDVTTINASAYYPRMAFPRGQGNYLKVRRTHETADMRDARLAREAEEDATT